jgi:hypothetical protein
MTAPRSIDPDAGIPDLVRRLGADARTLASHEVELVKLETRESVHRAGRGGLWLAMAFGVSIVALVAFTIAAITLVGRFASGHVWVGAIVTGLAEIGLAIYLFRRGTRILGRPSYTLEDTRAGVAMIAGRR